MPLRGTTPCTRPTHGPLSGNSLQNRTLPILFCHPEEPKATKDLWGSNGFSVLQEFKVSGLDNMVDGTGMDQSTNQKFMVLHVLYRMLTRLARCPAIPLSGWVVAEAWLTRAAATLRRPGGHISSRSDTAFSPIDIPNTFKTKSPRTSLCRGC